MIWEAKWFSIEEPIPEGWQLAHNEGHINDHHSHYARMIIREIGEVTYDESGSDHPGQGQRAEG